MKFSTKPTDEAGLEVKKLEERVTKAGGDAFRLGKELRRSRSIGWCGSVRRQLEGKLEAGEMWKSREEWSKG